MPSQGAPAGNSELVASYSKAERVLQGVVTLVDTNRNLVVLQEGEHPISLRLDTFSQSLRVGESVTIEGKVSPYFEAFPDYPEHPSGRDVENAFEAPTDWGKHYLAWMHGMLRPPKDGNYTFWIAADDEGELLLSTNQDESNAKEIASVPRATWPREWERYPQQRSKPVFLKAGETYYIEAIQRQWRGHDCLGVSWEGPGIQQSVIDGRYLLPDGKDVGGVTNGVVREYWTNFFVTALSMLVPEPSGQTASISEPRFKVMETGQLPQANLIHIGEPWAESNNFRWVEVEGRSGFVANNNGSLTMELTNADGRMTAHILNWSTNSAVSLENRKVRIRGVCESVSSEKGDPVAGALWVPDATQLTLLDSTPKDWIGAEPVAAVDLVPSNPNLAWGRKVLVRGMVLDHDPQSKILSVQGDDTFYAYISDDRTNWTQVGVPISVGVSNSVYSGVAVSSMVDNPLPVATFERVIGKTDTEIPDVGMSAPRDWTGLRSATFTIDVHSGGIDDPTEKCDFVFQPLADEGEIVARVKTFEGGHVSDKAGIMMRESLDADSPSVALMITSESKISLQYQTPGASSRVVSLVLNKTPRWLKLVRQRHLLTVVPRENDEVVPHQPMEIVGNLAWQDYLPVITEAYLRPAVDVVPEGDTMGPSSKPEYIRIKDLPSETKGGLQYASRSFRIRGVVTFSDKLFNRNLIFVQDDSGGAQVRVLPELVQYKPLEAGQFIEAEGSVKFTRGAAPFGVGSATVLGEGQMPAPLAFPDHSMAASAEGQWVEAEGVVRAIQDDGTLLMMEKDGPLKVWVKEAGSEMMKRYVDALVQVRGVYSRRVQTSHSMLLVPSLDCMQVKEVPPKDPFIIPSFDISQLGVQDVNPQTLHRLKVTGVVTYRDDNLVYVQDDTGSVQVLAVGSVIRNPGERVEVIGFPEKRSGSMTLTEAMVRRVGIGPSIKPVALSLSDMTDGRYNASVVRLEANVLEQKIRDGQQLLELQIDQRVFQAILPVNSGSLESIPPGSRVRITGVNRVQFASHTNAKTSQQDNPTAAALEVLLRGPADVVVVQRPPWWNWKYSAGLGVLGVVAFAGSFVWIRTLRRRVEERTRALKAAMERLQKETETSATLVERDRLAGEIHDSLEQGLNGIMMQLDGVDSKLGEDSSGARHFLEMARNMVRFSRAEVRHSLWNLESDLLANGDLGAALTEVAKQMSSSNGVQVTIKVLGSAIQLPPATEHHLLRICQEALNNALKHAHAKVIRITLSYSEKSVHLSVADDGCGFAPDRVLTGTGMHLGLRNLRSRARKVKGRLEVISEPARGTTIEVSVPINGAMDGTANHN